METVLVIDDEPSIVTLLKYNLEGSGYHVLVASDGKQGLNIAMNEKVDFIILDLMLPEMDGTDVCRRLRQEKIRTPILMLTARGDEFDKVLGLELGADDYLTKPFSPREVVARVKAILRRSTPVEIEEVPIHNEDKEIKIGKLKILPERYEAFINSELLELTPREFELLLYLGRNQRKVLSRDQLLTTVWNYDYSGDSRIVDVHISNLREKIEVDKKKPKYIKTVRGFGYKLESPK